MKILKACLVGIRIRGDKHVSYAILEASSVRDGTNRGTAYTYMNRELIVNAKK